MREVDGDDSGLFTANQLIGSRLDRPIGPGSMRAYEAVTDTGAWATGCRIER